MTRTDKKSGFTLAELIVAMTLTVLVSGSTVAILRSITGARRRASRQMALQQETRHAINVIATALHNGYRSGGAQAVLEGTDGRMGDMPADRVRFFTISRTTVRQDQPESDVKECEFFLAQPERAGRPALMQRIDPTRNAEGDEGGVLLRLAEGAVGLDMSYHSGREWLDEWPKTAKSWPLAIRIRLAVLSGDDPPTVWTTSRIVSFPRRPKARRQENK